MKIKSGNQVISDWGYLILFPVFLFGLLLLISKSFPEINIGRILLWTKYIALCSFVVIGGFFLHYFMKYGLISDSPQQKAWHAKRIAALLLTVFLFIMLIYSLVTSLPKKELVAIILGIALGSIYVYRGGSLPQWIIDFTQKFNFFTSGVITADDDPNNISPNIYLPIIGSAILMAIIAYFVFVKGL